MRNLLFLAAGLGLSGCVAAPRPAPRQPAPIAAPAPVRPAPPSAPLSPDWKDRPFAPGRWTLARDNSGSVAQFGQPGTSADFLIRCMVATKYIYFSRAGSVPEGTASAMTLASTETTRTYAAANSSALPAYIWSETPSSDPQLDSLALSRGRILVAVAGSDDLVIPSWPEFARIVEDCRG